MLVDDVRRCEPDIRKIAADKCGMPQEHFIKRFPPNALNHRIRVYRGRARKRLQVVFVRGELPVHRRPVTARFPTPSPSTAACRAPSTPRTRTPTRRSVSAANGVPSAALSSSLSPENLWPVIASKKGSRTNEAGRYAAQVILSNWTLSTAFVSLRSAAQARAVLCSSMDSTPLEGQRALPPARAPGGVLAGRSRAAGKIICISSVHAKTPWAGHANYGASKGGVSILMASMAQELGAQRIRVNGIAPGRSRPASTALRGTRRRARPVCCN